MITELRVYKTIEKLRTGFSEMAKWATSYDGVKIMPNREIYIPNILRIVFKMDRIEDVAGYKPDKVFIDEFVSDKVRDYLSLRN